MIVSYFERCVLDDILLKSGRFGAKIAIPAMDKTDMLSCIHKYINLDFKMLIDLSIIDMRIRKIMLSIVLDLEHYAKVKLLSKIENKSKDGYTIVEEYIQDLKDKNEYEYFEKELDKNKTGTYCGDLVTKYNGEYPIWVFVEIIPFGRLIKFYRFVANKLQDRKMMDESYMLMDVRELRNACAHNNCIINDLKFPLFKKQGIF